MCSCTSSAPPRSSAAGSATFKTPTVGQCQWYGAITQLVTGLLMVGLAEMGPDPVNYAKIAVKLLLGIGVFVAALIGRRKLAPRRAGLHRPGARRRRPGA